MYNTITGLSPLGSFTPDGTPAKKGFANVIWMVVFAAIAVVVLALVLTYGTDITEDVHDDQTANSFAANASEEGLEGLVNLSEKQGTMTNVIAAGAIIAILLAAFGGFALGKGRR